MPCGRTSLRNTPSAAVLFVAGLILMLQGVRGADLDECRKLFLGGNYAECIRVSESAIREQVRDEEWPILHTRALLALGRYPEALTSISNALQRYRWGVRLRPLGHEVYLANGKPEEARGVLEEVNDIINSRMFYRDAPSLVALGRAALLLKADPKLVLENLFDQAKRADPDYREVYLASGELALEKHDYALAAKTFSEALKKFPDDADVHFGLARAYAPNARPLMARSIEAALEHNANHVPAKLLLVDHLVDAEEYDEAGKILGEVLRINPWHPDAWAFRAVLAHLKNDAEGEKDCREKALKFWASNPRVDHLIGRKLSEKYRFAEGSSRQRLALAFDSGYLPARIQLAQDLMRLGEEEEGWRLAEQVHRSDGYDVTAYNLVTLRETLQKFKTVTNEEFMVRMSEHEAAIYGGRVLALLHRAKTNLTEKYGITLEQPTIVEIFPKQGDFAVRTFGMPHNPGFLGVCFGRVVTANSPASQGGHPSNWEAVLWHEFCHVITLSLTRNKMPRWLSEGISVYEERQANPAWGQHMNPQYREMILGDDLTPISELSAAFLSPESDLHVQFAYYESSLVVEFLVEKFGLDSLKQILKDLGEGREINEAIAAHTAPMEQLEKDFAAFARDLAEKLGPGLDWERPKERLALAGGRSRRGTRFAPTDEPLRSAETNLVPLEVLRRRYGLTNSVSSTNQLPISTPAPTPQPGHDEPGPTEAESTNYWVLTERAKNLLSEKKWAEAKVPLKKLVELYPNQTGRDNALAMLAAAHRGLNETEQEREVLARLALLDADNLEAFSRLMDLAEAAKDWTSVMENAERFLAVNPLLPQPYRFLARASEELGRATEAVAGWERLLLLDPPDPAEVHFHLARLVQNNDAVAAKRHVLQALEEAPRFRDAHRLLLKLSDTTPGETRPEPQSR